MANNPKPPKNLGAFTGGFNDPLSSGEFYKNLYTQTINSSPTAYRSYFSPEYYGPIIEQDRINNLKRKQYNTEFNSLQLLARSAFKRDEAYSTQYAKDLYNKINIASTPDELNSVYKELEDLRDKADSFDYLPDIVGQLGETLARVSNYLPWHQDSVKAAYSGITKDYGLLNEEDKNVTYMRMGSSKLLQNASSTINQKRNLNYTNKLIEETDDFYKQINESLRKPQDQNAFNSFLKTKFKDKIQTRGDEFYREDPLEVKNIYDSGLKAIDAPTTGDEKLFKYDLEKTSLQNIQIGLVTKLKELNQIPEEDITAQQKAEKQSLVNNLNTLEKRTKDLSKIYGLSENAISNSSTDRSGFFRSMIGTGIVPLANLLPGRSEFEKILKSTQVYQPEVIKYDVNGQPIMSNQFTYVKKNGDIGYNWGSIPELGGAMVGIIVPSYALGSFTGGVTAGLAGSGLRAASAAQKLSSGYDALNKYKGLKLADRLATFGTVTLTTAPMMIEEEKRWGGNYLQRGFGKALIEGATEAVGFPDIGALRARPFVVNLAAASRRITATELTFGEKVTLGLSASGQFGKAAIKQNVVEAFEEELSLLGNALLEHTMFDQAMFGEEKNDAKTKSSDKTRTEYRERTKVTGDELANTFVDSFLGGIVYSAGTNIVAAKNTLSRDNLYYQSNWQAANNPELFKAKLLDYKNTGKISDEEFIQGLGRINELETIFKSNVANLSKMKDLRTLLDDKDLQYSYFSKAVQQADLLKINLSDLSEDELATLGKVKTQRVLSDKAKVKINSLREEIAVLEQNKERTPEQEKELEQKSNQYVTLRQLNNAIVNRKDLDSSQLQFLESLGVKANSGLQFTQEDLLQEISSIDTSVLKFKQQKNKYENLSEAEKQNVIIDLFNERINALQEVISPNEIVESMENLQNDLEYLKTKGESNAFDIEQRERLYDAYGKKFEELTRRGENNLNSIEQKFETPGYYSNLRNTNNFYSLLEDISLLEENKDFIDSDLHKTIYENLVNILQAKLEDLNSENITPEKRIEILTEFYDKISSKSPLTLYNLEKTNNFFTINNSKTNEAVASANFTKEEMDAARQNVIDKRAQAASKKIAEGKKPYDESTEEELQPVTDTEPSLNSEQSEEVNKDLDEIFKETKDVGDDETVADSDEVDEEQKKLIDDAKFFYEKNKDKTPKQLAEVARNIARRSFNYNANPNSAYGILAGLGDKYFSGQITFEEYLEGIDDLKQKYPSKVNKLAVHQIFVSLANNDGKVEYVGKDASGVSSTAPTQKNEQKEESTFESKEDPAIKKRDEEVKTINEVRVKQLLSLASPLRTVGVELDRNDMPSSDVADQRRVKHLKEASSEDFPTNLKVALVNRQKFMQMYLEAKYPNKSADQIQQDLNTINEFFENSEENTPLTDEIKSLIGDTLFSTLNRNEEAKSQVNYWQSNKGTGFSKSPDVVVTFVNQDGSLYLFNDGFPLDLNATTRSEKRKADTIPWNVSSKIISLLANEGVTEEQILKVHAETFKNFEALKSEISKDNSKVVTADYNISEGVFIKSPEFKLGAVLKQENNPEIGQPSIDSFALVTREGQTVFGQNKKFQLGRVYYNVNGTPVQLSNEQISKEEAEALADIIFKNEFPEEIDPYFEDLQEFRDYLFNLINDVDKNSRIYFKENRNYSKENPEESHTNVLYRKNGKLTQLTKAEFTELLQKFYYKASADYIKKNKSIPRFEKIDGKIESKKQSYSDYLLSTHSFPINKQGEISKNVNQQVYFKLPEITKIQPVVTKPVVSEKPTTTKPNIVPPGAEVDSQGFVVASKSELFLADKDIPVLQFFVGSRTQLIQQLKDAGKAPNTQEFFSKMKDEDFERFIQGLTNLDLRHFQLLDANNKPIEFLDKSGLPKSSFNGIQVGFFNAPLGNYVLLKVNGTSLLIPTTSQENSVFNLEYQPRVTVTDLGTENEKTVPDKIDAMTVGVNYQSKLESKKKEIQVTQVETPEEESTDVFEDVGNETILAEDIEDTFDDIETIKEEPPVVSQSAPVSDVEVKTAETKSKAKSSAASRLNRMISDEKISEEAKETSNSCKVDKTSLSDLEKSKPKKNPF